MLDAVIADGPNKGLTLREAMALGLMLTGDAAHDRKRADEARRMLEKLRSAGKPKV